jgi:acetoin utilization deacetylase AcuC-like enzyme
MVVAFDPDAPLSSRPASIPFERDPIGDLALRTEDYRAIGRMIAGLGMPTVALQEGGYAVDALGANAVALLAGLRGA